MKVKTHSKNISRLKELGYKISEIGEEIEIQYKDIDNWARVNIDVRCDYCGVLYQTKQQLHYHAIQSPTQKDACKKCAPLKNKETSLMRYGVDSPMKTEKVKEKQKRTMLDKYGVNNPNRSKTIREKIKQTNLERYGFENAGSNSEVRKKARNTMVEKYGADCSSRCPEILQKIENTVLEKYGVKSTVMLPEMRAKAREGMIINGSQTTSKAQRYLHALFGGEINYPYRKYFIDIAFPEDKIAFEYNGSGHDLSVRYGHISPEKYKANETYRWKQLYAEHWKIITFESNTDKLPNDDVLLLLYNKTLEYLSSGRHWATINLDTYEFKTSQFSQILDIQR